MRSKKVLWAFLIIPLIFSAVPTCVGAQTTTVSLDPQDATVPNVGMNFTVNMNINDVTDLYSYELKLYYNSTLLNGTQVTEGQFLKSGGSTSFWVSNFTDTYNATHGLIHIICTLTATASGVSGSGVLMTIQFRSMATGGPSALVFANASLSDSNFNPITAVAVNGTFTVIPEFPLGIIQLTLMLFMIAALVIFVKKRVVKPFP